MGASRVAGRLSRDRLGAGGGLSAAALQVGRGAPRTSAGGAGCLLRPPLRPDARRAALHPRSAGRDGRGFSGGDVPGAEGEGDEEVWGVSDGAVGDGGLGWDGGWINRKLIYYKNSYFRDIKFVWKMIETIKEIFKEGDAIILHTNRASITGVIKSFSGTTIILIKEDGKIAGIKNDAIESFEATEFKSVAVPKDHEKNQKRKGNSDMVINSPEESNNSNTKSNRKDDERRVGLKIVGKIDLEKKEKERRKKKKAKKKYKEAQKDKGIHLKSLSDLKDIVLPETEEENKKFIPPNGRITKYWSDRGFGFIKDSFGNEIWFGFRNILEDELVRSFKGTQYNADIPVLFSLTKNYKGNAAVHIHRPKTINEAIGLAEDFLRDDTKIDNSLGILEQILDAFPGNYTSEKLKEQIEEKLLKSQQSKFRKKSFRTYDLNYQKAKKAHNVEKNYPEALRLYKLALENNEKRESCIKDIAMLFVAMDERDKALEFMQQYENELPSNITNYNFLENFYASVREFRKVIEYIDLLLEEKLVLNDKKKYSFFLSKKGSTYIQLKELEEARKYLEEAISVYSENVYASRLLEALDNHNKEELSQLIADAEFDTFGGGLSKFISDTIDKYEEYYGVPAKVIDAGDFTSETLNAIRNLINRAGRARPRERANYLLTEAKLMQLLEPEKDVQMRSTLARYCNAMALNHISENSPLDVVRYFYLEAFSLEENYRFTAPQVALYLISYKSTYSELLSTKTPSIEDALQYGLSDKYKTNIWEGILSMFLLNRSISAQLISKIFNKKLFKEDSLKYLMSQGISVDDVESIETYTNAWNQAREKRQRDYGRWFASIKAIHNVDNLAILASQLYTSLSESKKSWIPQLDITRLNTIASDILDVINQYLNQAGYKNKERNYNFAKAQINQLISEIQEKPTKFSYEGFIPLLNRIELLIDKDFQTVESASTPKLSISIEGDSNVIEHGKFVNLQIRVENSTDASPVRDLTLEVESNDDVTFLPQNGNNQYLGSIDGGDNHIFKNISLEISENVKNDKATTIFVKCHYRTRSLDEPQVKEDKLSLRLFSQEEFEPIPNPYEQLANGGPVTDTKMFYGRNEFIEVITDAILNADSKQVVIFGQKRSGKSSVLFHLKKQLEQYNTTFCVTFSIGDIFETLSSATFFYKILTVIEEELENLEYEGIEVPEFTYPVFSEFSQEPNPADVFRKYIRKFKRACKKYKGWSDKKLVVMIDEFTYLYTAIKEEKVSSSIMKQWKAITQNQDATFSAVLVGQDVFPEYKGEFPNEFGVTQDERLTYLSEPYARKLIEEPVWNASLNKSRFIGKAVDTIIEYTSCNPYYIQIFCARLITEMNRKKTPAATEADIKDVAESFITGGKALSDDKFDNLLNPGERHDIQKIPEKHAKAILRQIANGARNIGFCPRENISIEEFTAEYEDEILDDLVNREVLERKPGNNYKIQVKLFQEWLLKN